MSTAKADADALYAAAMSMGVDEVRENYLKLPFAYPGGKGEQLKDRKSVV